MAFTSLTPRDKFLGSMVDSIDTGMRTTTASTTLKKAPTSAPKPTVATVSPSATGPAPAPSPKTAFVQQVASAPLSAPTSMPAAPSQPTPITSGSVTTPSGATVNAGTGGLINNPPVNYDQQYQDVFEQYIRSLQPDQTENDANTYLRGLLDTSRREEERALNSGETLGFARGEAERVNRNRSLDIQAATDAVSALSGRRGVTSDILKSRMEYQKSLRGDKPGGFELSPGQERYEYDPATQQYKKVASGASKAPSTSTVEVNGQRVLINDETGETVRVLGTAGSGGGGTAAERKGEAFSQINQLLRPGVRDVGGEYDGEPYLDQNGYITPNSFKGLLKDALESTISRKEFLEEYTSYLYPGDLGDYKGYGLTASEIKELRGY